MKKLVKQSLQLSGLACHSQLNRRFWNGSVLRRAPVPPLVKEFYYPVIQNGVWESCRSGAGEMPRPQTASIEHAVGVLEKNYKIKI